MKQTLRARTLYNLLQLRRRVRCWIRGGHDWHPIVTKDDWECCYRFCGVLPRPLTEDDQ